MNVLLSVEVINYPQILGTVETPKGTRSKMWYLSTLSMTEPIPRGALLLQYILSPSKR